MFFYGGILFHILLLVGGGAVTVLFACGIPIFLVCVRLRTWHVHIGSQGNISKLWCPRFRPNTLEADGVLEQCEHMLVSHMDGDEMVAISVLAMVGVLHVAEGFMWLLVIVSAP